MKRQKLYVMQNEIGLVKIGISANPKKRANDIRLNSGIGVTILSQHATNRPAREIESVLHEICADKRQHGEWFTPNVLEVIGDNPSKLALDEIERRENERKQFEALNPKSANDDKTQPESGLTTKEFEKLLDDNGLSKAAFARETGLTVGGVQKWKNADKYPLWVETWLKFRLDAIELKSVTGILKKFMA